MYASKTLNIIVGLLALFITMESWSMGVVLWRGNCFCQSFLAITSWISIIVVATTVMFCSASIIQEFDVQKFNQIC